MPHSSQTRRGVDRSICRQLQRSFFTSDR